MQRLERPQAILHPVREDSFSSVHANLVLEAFVHAREALRVIVTARTREMRQATKQLLYYTEEVAAGNLDEGEFYRVTLAMIDRAQLQIVVHHTCLQLLADISRM